MGEPEAASKPRVSLLSFVFVSSFAYIVAGEEVLDSTVAADSGPALSNLVHHALKLIHLVLPGVLVVVSILPALKQVGVHQLLDCL